MAKFIWQDGTLVSKAKVEIQGTIYEVDPEEYSGATPLSASNLNAMQDGIYDDMEEADEENKKIGVYSTQEQVVGSWLGKPLYRKVIQYTKNTSGEETLNLSNYGITNVDSVRLNQDSFIKTTRDEYKPINNYESAEYYTFGVFPTNLSLRLSSNSGYANGIWNLIIEYTKTTD